MLILAEKSLEWAQSALDAGVFRQMELVYGHRPHLGRGHQRCARTRLPTKSLETRNPFDERRSTCACSKSLYAHCPCRLSCFCSV